MDKNNLIERINKNPDEINNLNIEQLALLIKECNHAYYYTDNPIFDDDIFDLLLNKLETLDKGHELLNDLSGEHKENTLKLPYYLGSLEKIKFNKDSNKLTNWVKKFSGPYFISEKLDGISGLLIINKNSKQLLTRGNGNYGRDISNILQYIDIYTGELNIDDTLYIRGELVISKDKFNKYSNESSHPRNFVSGLQNSKKLDSDKLKDVTFVSYEILNKDNLIISEQIQLLNELKFNTPEYFSVDNLDINILNEKYGLYRNNSNYFIDGIVIRDDNIHKLHDGKKSKNPKYAFAFKKVISEQVGISEVIDIEWNLSKDGYLIPKMRIKPLNIAGSIINYATCHHADFVVKNKLNKGSKVKIIRSGDVIPYVMGILSHSDEPLLPSNYDYEWSENKIDFIILNKKSNKEYQKQQIFNFFNVLNIRDLGEGILVKIINNDFNDINSILNITESDLLKIEGIQNKLANKIIKNLNSKLNSIDLITLMVASNCFGRGLGKKKLELFLNSNTDFLNDDNYDEMSGKLKEIGGFHDKTINKIIETIPIFKDFYNNLPSKIHDIINKTNNIINNDINTIVYYKLGGLKNKNIVLSGTREIEKVLIGNGINIQNTLNSKTDLLICKTIDSKSSKIVKAKEMGKKIIDITEFKNIYLV
jgi:NAD-dependent DNA ligase